MTFLAIVVFAAAELHAAAPRPNIIVVLIDDVGYSDLGCFGGEVQTPNLDKLAADGVRFTQFYNTARCCPTRAALLTGLYSHQAGIGHMTEDRGHDGYRGELNRRSVTLAEALRPAGYSTYMAGKWHVSHSSHMRPDSPKESWPLQRGFDRFYGTITGAGNYFDPAMLTRDNTCVTRHSDPEYRPARYYYTDALADNSIRFLREHRERTPEKPFLLYLAFTAAHWPLHALDEDVAKYRGKYDGGYEPIRAARVAKMKELGLIDAKWELSPRKGDWNSVSNKSWEARCMEVYAAQLDRLDQAMGRLVGELRGNGSFDNTLIFFMQDNGGCAEALGRAAPARALTRGEGKAEDFIFTNHHGTHTRDGRPYRTGPEAMPGPEDTYISYGAAWANVSNTPFREYKHWVHEGGISTPLIVHWPRGVAKSRRGKLDAQPGHLIDIMATCVDVSGASYPKTVGTNMIQPLEGTSLAPAFKGKSLARKNPIFWEHEGNRAIRDGRWKLVARENDPWELYDMKADRTEQHDLASSEPRRAKDLSAQWDQWASRANVLPIGTWRGGKGAAPGSFSAAKGFTLKAGDHLERESAPHVARRAFTITAKFEGDGQDGVIVAQGGSSQGYALFVREGKLVFALRRAGVLTSVSAGEVSKGAHAAMARVSATGELSLTLDGQSAAGAKAAGVLPTMPQDGLEVGRDDGGLVGGYGAENSFKGRISAVEVRLE